MAAQRGGTRCEYCWHPIDVQSESGATLHNQGCPTIPMSGEEERLWEQGRAYGFDDQTIPYWLHGHYNPSFILGYRVGKAEIDGLVEQAVESRGQYSGGER